MDSIINPSCKTNGDYTEEFQEICANNNVIKSAENCIHHPSLHPSTVNLTSGTGNCLTVTGSLMLDFVDSTPWYLNPIGKHQEQDTSVVVWTNSYEKGLLARLKADTKLKRCRKPYQQPFRSTSYKCTAAEKKHICSLGRITAKIPGVLTMDKRDVKHHQLTYRSRSLDDLRSINSLTDLLSHNSTISSMPHSQDELEMVFNGFSNLQM